MAEIRRVRKPIRIDRPGLHVVGDVDAVIATGSGEQRTSVASTTQNVEITQRTRSTTRGSAKRNDNPTGGTHA